LLIPWTACSSFSPTTTKTRKPDPEGSYMGAVSIATKFFQILAILGKLDVGWPPSVKNTITALSAPFTLRFQDFLAPECSAPSVTYVTKWVITVLLPVFFLVVFGLVFLGLRLVKRQFRSRVTWTTASISNRIINAYLSLFSLGYLSLTLTAMEPFGCKAETDGSSTFVADPSRECTEPWWYKIAIPAGILTVLYVVAIPLILIFLLKNNKHRMTHPDFVERYSSLYSKYSPSLSFWEPIVMLEEIGIAACGQFLSSFVMFQVIALQILFMATVNLYQVKKPYLLPDDNRLHGFLRWCCLLVLFAAVLFKLDTFTVPWARRAVEVAALLFIFVGIGIIVGSVGLRLWRLRRAKGVAVLPELSDELVVMGSSGQLAVMRWLKKKGEDGVIWQKRLYSSLSLFSTYRETLDAMDNDPLADMVVAAFTRGIFRDDVVPYLRSWLDQNQGHAGHREDQGQRDFVACLSDMSVSDSRSKRGSKSKSVLSRLTASAVKRSRDKLDESGGSGATTGASRMLGLFYGGTVVPFEKVPLDLVSNPHYLDGLYNLLVANGGEELGDHTEHILRDIAGSPAADPPVLLAGGGSAALPRIDFSSLATPVIEGWTTPRWTQIANPQVEEQASYYYSSSDSSDSSSSSSSSSSSGYLEKIKICHFFFFFFFFFSGLVNATRASPAPDLVPGGDH
jgi:hypothetical protein